MDFRGKKSEDLVVTLSFQDGTTADYGVHKYFTFKGKEYFAMLPVTMVSDRSVFCWKPWMKMPYKTEKNIPVQSNAL